ncbi:hypothetical protein Tco_1350258 [Tanacetum coccineum]
MEYRSTLKSCLARVKNNDGKVLGKDGKPMKVLYKVQFEAVRSTPNTDSNDGLKKVNDVEAQSIRVTSDVAGSSPIISMTPMDSNGDGTNRILNQQDGVGNIAAMSSDNTKPTSFASMLKDQSGKRVVHLKMVSNNVIIPGADVAIPIEAVDVISNRFNNTLYGYFIRKRIAFPVVENYVKNTWAKYGIECTMMHDGFFFFQFSTKAGMEQGCNTYARALVEVSTDKALVESLVVAIPYQNEKGYSMETVEIEYEWRPSRCDNCKNFDHKDNDCPKKLKEVTPTPAKDDGFVQVTRKKDNVNKIFYVNDTPWNEATSVNDDLIDDDDDVEEVFMEHVPSSHGLNGNADKKGASTPNIEWKWTSNGVVCLKGSRIILGWNMDIVDVVVILFDEQVMHMYFNIALYIDDKSAGTSNVDTALRDFQECVEDIEVSGVNCSGLRFTWNQKPQGKDGILKKIDRIMANLGFSNTFTGANAVFQPYRISDHSPAILRGFLDVQGCESLKLLKKTLRKLLYNQGNIFETVKHLRHELDEVQCALDSDPSNPNLREEEAAYLQAFKDASLVDERFLQQKAKVEWLHLGDANTAYFYKVIKSQVSRNRDDKSLGPDGYSAAFFKDAWNIIEHDVIKVVQEFFY